MMEKNLNAILALILAFVMFGAYDLQIFKHETPCPLCLLQRLGMLGVATGAILNIRFGIRTSHYGISLLSAVFGGFVALRQIALHVCPGTKTFGKPFLGLSLYTWSFLVFVSSVTYIAILLFLFDYNKKRREDVTNTNKVNILGYAAFAFVFFIAFMNILTTLWQCGLGPCLDVP